VIYVRGRRLTSAAAPVRATIPAGA